ncbi:hypothetical protein FH972_000800 [Carpinus fangiana]|uniref:Uncharacterized protein n=1 Tax=Carpinus fangiana TaxID=176857 RepID=A0A5N6QC61_9ROSI|nr:hypothetical protein FH972_000800 [Carpinus fangiana]
MISVASSSTEPQNQEFSAPKIPPTNPSQAAASVFKSKLPEIPISDHLPLHTYCFEHLAKFADRPCLIIGSTGKTYSFAETHLVSRKVAAKRQK